MPAKDIDLSCPASASKKNFDGKDCLCTTGTSMIAKLVGQTHKEKEGTRQTDLAVVCETRWE